VHLDQVAVVRDERAGGAEVNDATRRRRRLSEGVHVRHHVVAESLLVFCDLREMDVVEMQLHLGDGFRRNVHAEVALGLREREPQTPPEPVPCLRRPKREHRCRGVTLGER